MKILSIDTTENTAAGAVLENDRLLATMQYTKTRNHSESMLPMIETLLSGLHLTPSDIDLFALAAGPGSFTGVRIGAATIKGLTFGTQKPIMALSGIEGMAYNFLGMDGIVCPGMDARRSQVYSAIFRVRGERVERLTPDRVILIPNLIEELKTYDEPIRFAGGGYDLMVKAATDAGLVPIPVPEPIRYENAWGIGRLAYLRYSVDPASACDDRTLKPIYLQLAQAERERIEKEQSYT